MRRNDKGSNPGNTNASAKEYRATVTIFGKNNVLRDVKPKTPPSGCETGNNNGILTGETDIAAGQSKQPGQYSVTQTPPIHRVRNTKIEIRWQIRKT